MPSAPYNYIPIYGIDEYDPDAGANGGAKESNDNLIVTVWEVAAQQDTSPYITFGDIIIPKSALDATVNPAAFEQAMLSRVSGKFFIEQHVNPKIVKLLLVMRPPQELRQQVAAAVVYNGGDPTDLASYTVSDSLQGDIAWHPEQLVSNSVGENVIGGGGAIELKTSWSTYLALNLPAGGDVFPLPYLRTNGANGVAPQFFDRDTAGGVREMIEAVDKGEFFVAYVVNGDFLDGGPPSGGSFEITWPHSIARG